MACYSTGLPLATAQAASLATAVAWAGMETGALIPPFGPVAGPAIAGGLFLVFEEVNIANLAAQCAQDTNYTPAIFQVGGGMGGHR